MTSDPFAADKPPPKPYGTPISDDSSPPATPLPSAMSSPPFAADKPPPKPFDSPIFDDSPDFYDVPDSELDESMVPETEFQGAPEVDRVKGESWSAPTSPLSETCSDFSDVPDSEVAEIEGAAEAFGGDTRASKAEPAAATAEESDSDEDTILRLLSPAYYRLV